MEREPQLIKFPRTELAEVPTDRFSYQRILYTAIGQRHPGKVYINEYGDGTQLNASDNPKVFFSGGPGLMELRNEIRSAQIGLSGHGIRPILQDVEAGNWPGLLLYIQNGAEEYFESKDMENVTSPLSFGDVVGCFVTACDRARERSGGSLPEDVENLYRGYRESANPATSEMLAGKVAAVVSSFLDQERKAA